jgi:SPP1 gp7 family putative phage head morphogenesis protein
MANVNTEIYDRVVDRAAMIRLYEQSVYKKLDQITADREHKIVKLIESNKAKLTPALREAIDREIQESYNITNQTVKRSLYDLISNQVSYTYQTLENAVGKIFTVKRPARTVAEDFILSKPLYQNKTLEQGWASIASSERVRIESVIRKGISKGLSESDIALSVRKGNAINISRAQAVGLTRTSITSVYAQADQAVYQANAKILKGWQYVAVLDSRTSSLCAFRNGTIYPVDDTSHLPPAHWHCRSTTVPVVKSYDDLNKSESISRIRKKNFEGLSDQQREYFDGSAIPTENYTEWLRRQPKEVQLKHLGDNTKVNLLNSGQFAPEKFSEDGRSLSIEGLKASDNNYTRVPGDTQRFAEARSKLDSLDLGAARPEDIMSSPRLRASLKEYYRLQSGDLGGTLSYTNYRGTLIHTKKAMRQRVVTTPPTEQNLRYNPLTGRYDDARRYQPNPKVLANNLRLVDESPDLLDQDKDFINSFIDDLADTHGVNERAVIADNLRTTFSRYRKTQEPWSNLKGALNGQIPYDVMNVSDYIETQLRRDSNLLYKLSQQDFIDPVLGPVALKDLSDNLIPNIFKKNAWEDRVAPKLGRELRNVLDRKIPLHLKRNLEDSDLEQFYLKFAKRLSLADSPDRDQLAVSLGKDLYNLANYRGARRDWYNLGVKLLDDAHNKGFYTLETYGVQRRRMKSKMGNHYFGPYYDTQTTFLVIKDKRILEYAKLTREVDVGLRVGVTNPKNKLYIREGYKTYFDRLNRDTRIPITSVDSFGDFDAKVIGGDMADALNWASSAEYRVDEDFFDFTQKLLRFEDDKGKAKYFHELNEYRKYILERGDAYERFKAMEYFRKTGEAFANHPFLDHRLRIYERGFIGPQSGETFRPFLNTKLSKELTVNDYKNLQDQIGSFLGGLDDALEGNFNSLSVVGRQNIATKWRSELVKIGDHMRRGKPGDIRDVLESPLLKHIDGEDQGKALRFALEMSRINEHVKGDFSNLSKLKGYKTALALEQDASSSGAQIIALTTKNKQLAELSNVVATSQKKRLYDEIAAATYADPRFKKLNERLMLTEKDLRKAAKAQNMVTFYGAGEKTGILNVEGKLAKSLGKQDNILVVKAADRDTVLNEISARMARYEKLDPDLYQELRALRQDVKDIFNKGMSPGDDIMEQLYFLDPKTRDLVAKMTGSYNQVVSPDDFATIAKIMSENLGQQVPILKDFTRFLGKLAETYVAAAKPKEASFDYNTIVKTAILDAHKNGKRLPPWLSQLMGIKDEPIRDKILRRIPGYAPEGLLDEVLFGVRPPKTRRTGFKIGGVEIYSEDIVKGLEVGYPNKLPKNWTQVPWVNFDGRVLDQHFTQTFEEKLLYKNPDGTWATSIVMVKQKTDPTLWESFRNKTGKINDIVDAQKARTAYAVNGNHSNDAVIVKRFHEWGKEANVQTSTIHDAFFTNAADMTKAKTALRHIYADVVNKNVIKDVLDEMLERGLPRNIYLKHLNEAIDIGLIPVVGRSKVGGRVLKEEDILKAEDILERIDEDFKKNRSWYGIG